MESVAADRGFARCHWDQSVDVEVTTLDALIADPRRAGLLQDRCRGLRGGRAGGLCRPLRALSFEYLPMAHDATLAGARVGRAAGGYLYNYSPIETMRFATDRWLDAAELIALLDRYRPLGRSGDVYARLA